MKNTPTGIDRATAKLDAVAFAADAVKFESLAPDLQSWFRDTVKRGSTPEAAVKALLASGYQERYARDAVDAAYKALPKPAAPPPVVAPAVPVEKNAAPAEAQTLSAQLVQMPNTIVTADREIQMLFALTAPRIVLFGNLLSHEECDQMIELSRDKLERSSVVNAETGAYDIHPHRTSRGTYFNRGENDLIRRIETRIAELVQFPEENGEPIQILHYEPGGEYKPHFDYFDPKLAGNEHVLTQGGQRIATLVMYLNDVEAGGSTVFPEVGIDVLPRKGNAVYFAYCSDTGVLDTRSLHGGSPVGAGEKWIATKWIRERAYIGSGA
ncbi:MAG TPA: 2OG-Fe(II) oxygenase [Burkholderiaceae bacterium]|nr:2OG-Fe(II) oxygenase [Burkholderiaceae bacterium]HQR71586.1 2OG-Fe(II) oxygenase [Burkholderiaceae bacterium]